MFKKCKVVMLPTKEKAMIHLTKSNILIISKELTGKSDLYKSNPQHLYILSDEEIKKDDWIYDIKNKTIVVWEHPHTTTTPNFKKIIATTDRSLKYKAEQSGENAWYNPLPQVSNSFINKYVEEYNKGNIITDVMVEYGDLYVDDNVSGGYKPEYKLKINSKDNTITIKKVKNSWDRKEVESILLKLMREHIKFPSYNSNEMEAFYDNWIKENL